MYVDMTKLLEKYLKYADQQRDCTLSGDYRHGNMAARKLERIDQQLKDMTDTSAVYRFIDSILETENPNTIMWISLVCHQLQYRLPMIMEKLTAYSTDDTLGILSFNAMMVLKQITSAPQNKGK